MASRVFTLILALLYLSPLGAQPTAALFGDVEQILGGLAEITGLAPKRKVLYDTIRRDELKTFFEQRIEEVVKPEELRIEELTLKKFGLIPRDFDLKSATIDMMTEQAAAFYDFRRKKLFVLEGTGGMLQQAALVHELAHALADQHFNLDKFLKRAGDNDDGSLARMAVMEGQATWLMSEYLARRTGGSLKDSPGLVDMMSQTAAMAGGEFPVFQKAPLYLRESLVFPYAQGMRFQHELFLKLDRRGFSEPFRRPPASTREVLHPEVYFAGEKPAEPELPVLSRPAEWRRLSEGSVGEFDFGILLRQYATASEAAELAARWRGGRYRLLENKRDSNRHLLMHVSEWEDARSAGRFFSAYRQVIEGKEGPVEILEQSDSQLSGRCAGGVFVVSLQANRVLAWEGLSDKNEARWAGIN